MSRGSANPARAAGPRYVATHLGAVLACQGRTQVWLAARLGRFPPPSP
ncbi:MAG: hypothetical protein R2853_09815 [Thermomicrobiales bacterium]